MGTINLTLPISGNTITAGLHATNYAAIQAAINGNIESTNILDGTIATGDLGFTTPVLISDQALSGANFDLQSISSVYRYLKIVCYLRGSEAAANNFGLIRFNNDSGANYNRNRIWNNGGVMNVADAFGQTSGTIGNLPMNSATANRFGSVEITIPNYANAVNHKVAHCQAMGSISDASHFNEQHGIVWKSAVAISRIQILPSSGTWSTGSRITVYGF